MICNDYELGVNAFNAGDFDASLDYLQRAVEAEPEHWEARRYLAFCYKKLKLHYKAQRAFRYISERCPIEGIRQDACTELVNAGGPAATFDFSGGFPKLDL